MTEQSAESARVKPRDIHREETRYVRWVVVGGSRPVDCDCGHPHYPRSEFVSTTRSGYGERTMLAPQWNFCEDLDCTCASLRRTRPPCWTPHADTAEADRG